VAAAEQWFIRHGLPYFVDSERETSYVLGGSVLSVELVQVSVFLAAFSGPYFTVVAVTDEVYREQFFTSITRELERAVGARTVYYALRTRDRPR
jgi:hypothetical protein